MYLLFHRKIKNYNKRMNKKEKFKKILLLSILCLLPLISMKATSIDSNNSTSRTENTEYIYTDLKSIESSLISETKTYIKKYYKICPNIIPTYIVKAGLKNNIDICFMLAQTQLETTFGKNGVGQETSRRSLFGIEKRYYKDYPTAIDAYINLLTSSYLVKGHDENYLMKHYVNKSGRRYAGNLRYEVELTKFYKQIRKSTNIKELQAQYKKLNNITNS